MAYNKLNWNNFFWKRLSSHTAFITRYTLKYYIISSTSDYMIYVLSTVVGIHNINIIHFTKYSPCLCIIIICARGKPVSVCLLPTAYYNPEQLMKPVVLSVQLPLFFFHSFRSILHCWPLIIDVNKLQSYVRLLCINNNF